MASTHAMVRQTGQKAARSVQQRPTFKDRFHALFLILAFSVATLQVLSSNSCLTHYIQPILQKQETALPGISKSSNRFNTSLPFHEATLSGQSGVGFGGGRLG